MNVARREVVRQQARLDAAFQRIHGIKPDELEARADFAKYLCVRVSGYLETSIAELLRGYAVDHASTEVANFVGGELEWFQNAKKDRILELFAKFDKTWRDDLEAFLVDEKAAAVGSIIGNRHKIAHGEDSTITYTQVQSHWAEVKVVTDFIADLLDPQ